MQWHRSCPRVALTLQVVHRLCKPIGEIKHGELDLFRADSECNKTGRERFTLEQKGASSDHLWDRQRNPRLPCFEHCTGERQTTFFSHQWNASVMLESAPSFPSAPSITSVASERESSPTS